MAETLWVIWKYGAASCGAGLAVSLVLVVIGARCRWAVAGFGLLGVAVLALWAGLFFASDGGYRAWQSIPEAPEAAFADTEPLFFLVAGWLPALMLLVPVFFLVRWLSRRTGE